MRNGCRSFDGRSWSNVWSRWLLGNRLWTGLLWIWPAVDSFAVYWFAVEGGHTVRRGSDRDGYRGGYSEMMDQIYSAFRSLLDSHRFERRGYTYNRTTEDDLTQVIDIQVYPSSLPYVGWDRYLARFTVNLGVYVPEVVQRLGRRRTGSWVEEPECSVRTRLAQACGDIQDTWWPLPPDESDIDDIVARLKSGGLPFLERYATRDKILDRWNDHIASGALTIPAAVLKAIILVERGDMEEARNILAEYVQTITMPEHENYIRKIAKRIGIWRLDT